MAENQVQPPRYTSTPLAGRKTSNILNNLIEVSPIFSTTEKVKNVKSMIPVLTTNEMKSRMSNGVHSIGAKTKGSTSTKGSVPHISSSQTKPKVLKPSSAKEPRNSVDEVIDSVIRSQSAKESETPSQEIDVQEIHQTKSSRVSKVSQEPPALPSVPEEVSVAGNNQLSEDCIFKKSEAQTGWLIPKETKNRVSLKRKSSVPSTVAKRKKKTLKDLKEDDGSLFDSPDLPNLVEMSSLKTSRQTYVLKKNTVNTDVQEDCLGIIPLDILSQKSSSINVSDECTKVKPKEKQKATVKKTDELSIETGRLAESEDEIEGKENNEKSISPDVQACRNNRELTKNLESEPKVCDSVDPSKSKSESTEKGIMKETTVLDTNNVNKINGTVRTGEEVKVNIIAENSKETKKKITKSRKKEINLNENVNSDTKSVIGTRRTLRERKANIIYLDTSAVTKNNNSSKQKNTRKKNVPVSQEHKENSVEPPVKSQRKKAIKGSENNDRADLNLVLYSENQDKKANKSKNNKEVKRVLKKKSEIPVEEIENEKDIKQNNSTKDETSSPKRKSQKKDLKKLNSLANNFVHQVSGLNAENCTSIDSDFVLHRTNSAKSTSTKKTRSDEEEQNKFKTFHNNSVSPVTDKDQLIKPTEGSEDKGHCSKGGNDTKTVAEKGKPRRRTVNNCASKGLDPINCGGKFDVLPKMPEIGACLETESCISSGKKRKSEEEDYTNSQSESRFHFRERKQRPIEFWKNQTSCSPLLSVTNPAVKRRKCVDSHSGKINNADRAFSIKDLFGENETTSQELEPGVVATRSIHINNFVMMGEVLLEPGASLNKISTNTTYSVVDGTACVTIKKHTKCFSSSDEQRRFFIPKNIDVSITNPGNIPLKMEFVKFRG